MSDKKTNKVTVRALANRLGLSPVRVRTLLRSKFNRQKGSRWAITEEDAREIEKSRSISAKSPLEHDKEVANTAYREAAICTIKKFQVFQVKPIEKALKDIRRYEKYLRDMYKI
jgi:hypothetical protein